MNTFKYNYKTTLPKEANAPSVTIDGAFGIFYDIEFYSVVNGNLILINKNTGGCGDVVYASSNQWFTQWVIVVKLNNVIVDVDTFSLSGKIVFIKMDAYALGDNIAWIPYVEEFRKEHNCIVLCSTFYNDLFSKIYPNILFAPTNTNIDNVYTQYYIGASNDGNTKYSRVNVDEVPLQMVPTSILGLNHKEIRPPLENQFKHRTYSKKYVCISEYASSNKKMWAYEGGWQLVVDWLVNIGYDVVVISKEPTGLNNVIDLTGDNSILNAAQTLLDADFFIGVSSGLSWLSWAVNTHTFMISDYTQVSHEFTENITRISANEYLTRIDYDAPNVTEPSVVIDSITNYLENNSR